MGSRSLYSLALYRIGISNPIKELKDYRYLYVCH